MDALNTIQVKGRLEIYPTPGDYTLMIDYAHNAMALEALLTNIRAYGPKRIICLSGAAETVPNPPVRDGRGVQPFG